MPRDDTDDDDEEEDNKDLELFPVKFLAKIAKEQRFDVTYVEIEEVSKKVETDKDGPFFNWNTYLLQNLILRFYLFSQIWP